MGRIFEAGIRAGCFWLGSGVAYLGTLRPDGSPRVHPVTPILGDQLFLFMEPTSPKGKDLQRDPRYTLHCAVEDSSGGAGEFYVRGRAQLVQDSGLRAQAVEAATYDPAERYLLFALSVEFAFMNVYMNGEPNLGAGSVRPRRRLVNKPMEKKIFEFLSKHAVCSLTTLLPDGSPHAAALHFSYNAGPLELYFLTKNASRKTKGLLKGERVRGAVVVGFRDENRSLCRWTVKLSPSLAAHNLTRCRKFTLRNT